MRSTHHGVSVPAGRRQRPAAVCAQNADKSFIGQHRARMGFTFDDTDKKGIASPIALMHDLIGRIHETPSGSSRTSAAKRSTTARRMQHHRYVINFEQMSRRSTAMAGLDGDRRSEGQAGARL